MISIDIVIPTYNRYKPLIRNLSLLTDIIPKIQNADISIIVSDNASTDGTADAVKRFIEECPDVNILLFSQKENVGLTRNVISCVKESNAEYVLILGDDDFINEPYLQTAVNYLNNDKDITCILPAFEAITEDGEHLGEGRDLGKKTYLYDSGIKNIIENVHRAHQISGIILRREGLYNSLITKHITNLYPQIFMTAISCLHGKCLHLPEYPILVTKTNNKAWNYDDTGLLNDIFQNFQALDLDDKFQFQIERKLVVLQKWRFLHYRKNPIKQIKVIFNISNGPYTSLRGKFLFPSILSYYWVSTVITALLSKLKRSVGKV